MPPYPISPMTSTSLAARCPGTPPHPQRSAGQWGQPHPVAVRFGVRLYLRNVLCGYALGPLRPRAPRRRPRRRPPRPPRPPACGERETVRRGAASRRAGGMSTDTITSRRISTINIKEESIRSRLAAAAKTSRSTVLDISRASQYRHDGNGYRDPSLLGAAKTVGSHRVVSASAAAPIAMRASRVRPPKTGGRERGVVYEYQVKGGGEGGGGGTARRLLQPHCHVSGDPFN